MQTHPSEHVYKLEVFLLQIYFSSLALHSRQYDIFLLNRIVFVTEGEFHVDLYTLPDSLVKMLWDFVS